MTTLNTIIEEEKKEFDKRFMQDGELLTAFDGKDDASDIKSHLTTAMQRAYEAGKVRYRDWETDRKSTRLNSSHLKLSRMPSSA